MNNIIPKINISELMKNGLSSKRSNKIIKKIETACLGSGFFEIEGHSLKSEVNSILKVCFNALVSPLNIDKNILLKLNTNGCFSLVKIIGGLFAIV